MLEKKEIKLNNKKITIEAFNVREGFAIRSDIVNLLVSQIDIKDAETSSLISAIPKLLYTYPIFDNLEVFKNCKCDEDLDFTKDKDVNKFFEGDPNSLDNLMELFLEVLNVNGFFTKNTLIMLKRMFPMFAKNLDQILDFLQENKD